MSLRFTIYPGEPILVANFYDKVTLDEFREWALRLPYYTRMFDANMVFHIIDLSRAEIDEGAIRAEFQQERGTWGTVDFKNAGGKQVKGWIVSHDATAQTVFHLIGKPELGGAYLPIFNNLADALYTIHAESEYQAGKVP